MKIADRGVMLEPTRRDVGFAIEAKRSDIIGFLINQPYYCTIYDLMRAGF